VVKRTDGEASLYGSQDGYGISARGVGDHHWISSNQRPIRQLPGAPNTFLASGTPSTSNCHPHLSMHPEEHLGNAWSNRHTVENTSYGVQLEYPQPDSFPGATQIPEGNFYSSRPPESDVTVGSFKVGENRLQEKYFQR